MDIKFNKVSHVYKGARKKDDVFAIEEVDLSIDAKDEFIAVIGQTGSGKTTLIQHINGLLLPSEGSLDVLGSVITSKKRKNPPLKTIRKKIGFLFQFPEYQLFEETVAKDILFATKIFDICPETANKRLKEVAKLLGITDILNKSPFNLSGGQMRKVALAGVLIYDPDILVLDEPTRGLDPATANETMELFHYINKEQHKTIILISHDMNLVYEHSTRVVVMKDGKKKYDGSKEELFRSDIYKSLSLTKPEVLSTIDVLNKDLGYNLDYNNYSLKDLVKSLGGSDL